jgi:Fe-S oxidoreductase/nitrate reductase gamma subunit
MPLMRRAWLLVSSILLCLHPAGALSFETRLLDEPGRVEATGLASSSSPALDFRTNGFVIPMYTVFLSAAALFLAGAIRDVRRWRGRADDGEGGPARTPPRTDPPARGAGVRRGWSMLTRLVILGLLQRKILARRFSGWMHLSVFWGFVVLALGSFVILIDSYVLRPFGVFVPRGLPYKIFQSSLEVAGIALIFGVSLALYRHHRRRRDGTEIDPRPPVLLLVLLGMALSGFALEGLRIRLEAGPSEPWSFVGSAVARVLRAWTPSSGGSLLSAYRVVWWCHAVTAFGLIAAIPYSRLRHAFTSPLNILVSSPDLSGRLQTPFDLGALMAAGSFDVKVGARALGDFTWRERLALSACADSGRCQDVCPAHETGTPLSPQRLMGALRQTSEAAFPGAGGGPALVGGAVSADEVWACTLCGACTDACPVLADPLDRIVQLRRGLVAANESGRGREEVLANLARSGNPYGSPQADRQRLTAELGARSLAENEDVDLLYWIGCAATYDPRARGIARAMVRILNAAGIRFGILGAEENCNGELARRIGEEGLFQELALKNIRAFERYGVRKILTHCAHCFNTFRNEYPEFGARIEVVHHTTLLDEFLRAGRIKPTREIHDVATLHDACYLARFNRSVEAPRSVLRAIPGLRAVDMARSGTGAFCCGAGGANYWYEVPRRMKMSALRLQEAARTGAGILVSECPYCLKMFEDGLGSRDTKGTLRVRDIAEVVADSL